MIPRAPLTNQQLVLRGVATLVGVLMLGFLVNLVGLSHVQHLVSQQQLLNVYRDQLALGTAPVSEGTFDDILLSDGDPVAILSLPSVGVEEVVVEGTSSGDLTKGPGHRRDTVLPGQFGVSVIMGRAAAYGGPFSRIQELAPGERFWVITGQGRSQYEVIGVRYAGDVAPPPIRAGEGRLILETARGPAYMPSGVARVDAQLITKPEPTGRRQTTFATLPLEEREMATDTRTVWALVFALQLLIAAELGAVWSLRRVGRRKTWMVFLPVLTLAGTFAADQLTRLLPNLL
jgi:LPXTG-site transpeptidase (sortase) family protein